MYSGMSWYILMYFGHWPVASGLWRCLPKTMLATSPAWFERGAASRRRLAEDTAGYHRIRVSAAGLRTQARTSQVR